MTGHLDVLTKGMNDGLALLARVQISSSALWSDCGSQTFQLESLSSSPEKCKHEL